MKRIASAVLTPTGPNYTQSIETGGFTLLAEDRKGWNIGELKVALMLSKDAEGGTFIDRTLESDADLDEAQGLKLLDIASKTPVTKTLLAGASITTRRAEVT